LQCLEFALSGYNSAFGMYPAVQPYQNPNLTLFKQDDDYPTRSMNEAQKATTCARAQPIAFEYPTPLALDEAVSDSEYRDKLQSLVKDPNAISINKLVDSLDSQKTSWADNKGFKFGLMSFLLPRVDVVGLPNSQNGPATPVFVKGQWKANNPMSKTESEGEVIEKLLMQQGLEAGACKRWLPNLENAVSGFKKEVYGIRLAGGGHGLVKRGTASTQEESGQQVYLAQSTIVDGWGREFFYYSAPPHQSYRIWSAGPDGNTFPPWEPLTEKAKTWIKDDIVSGKM
jgi:Type II secretion system (T2SS), protein G